MAPADPPPGADGKRRRLQSKTCSTLAPYHAPLSTSLPSARLPCTSQGTAPAAAPIESEPERLALRGLNIQWPFSQLILAGIKTAEVRGYTLGHRNPNVLPGEEVWLIETKGTSEAPGNAVGDRACFGERPQKARIVGTVTFSHAERYADVTAFRADVSNHCICEGGDKDWDGSGERYAWRIASVSALQEPHVDPVKTQTGIPAPATFEVVFSARDRRPRQVDAEVAEESGECSLHRLKRACSDVGAHILESEGLQAMVGPEEEEAEAASAGNGGSAYLPGSELGIVTVNVDGLGSYRASPSARMEDILTAVLSVQPDVLLLQEVVMEMYGVVQRRLSEWKVYRRRQVAEEYFNVTAVKSGPASSEDKTSSYAFPSSPNGRHLLTVRRSGWTIVNVHAESGGRQEDRDEGDRQLTIMKRLH